MNHVSRFLLCLVTLFGLSAAQDRAWSEDDSAKPRVLILGDSISIGYTNAVRELLKDKAVVVRPTNGNRPENCAGTNKGVEQIDRWLKLEGGRWDVIHFNFGLHDLKRVDGKTGKNSNQATDPHQAPPERYEKQLTEIVRKLKSTGAKLIFATTTPVPAGGVKPYRDLKDPERYNQIARGIMDEHGVAINDLYGFALPRLKQIQRPVNVHFTAAGSQQLAGEVARHIRTALKAESAAKTGRSSPRSRRANILWIVIEDMSAHFGCYGETAIQTPNIDRLASQGTRFSQAFVTAPVCSTCRSALVTGMYQTSIGAHQHRSGRGERKINLPQDVPLVPALFQAAGYYTCNGAITNRGDRIAKTDYNFQWDQAAYDGPDWSKAKPGQPFFAQIQLRGGKLRSGKQFPDTVKKELGSVTPADHVKLPPYYPDDPVVLEDWARYLDAVRYTDMEVGKILKRLEDEGIADSTYVFLITDHGISHVRGKQFCYDEGMRIPMIVRGPRFKAGEVRDDLVVHIDLAATSLGLAGIELPPRMEAVDLLADDYQPREAIVSARDRCDETVDRIRAVRTDRFKYIRNFYPNRPYLQPNAYKDHKPILIAMRRLHAAGKLNDVQSLIMANQRPAEELYDLQQDPHELNNLAKSPQHLATLARLRKRLDDWITRSGDQGAKPESPAMYDSDMAVYLQTIRRRAPDRAAIIQANIDQMKKWAAAGK